MIHRLVHFIGGSCIRWSLRLGLGWLTYGCIRWMGRVLKGFPWMVEWIWKEDFDSYRALASAGGISEEAIAAYAAKAILQSKVLKISGYGSLHGLNDVRWQRRIERVNAEAFFAELEADGGVILVVPFCSAQGAIIRFLRQCPQPVHYLGKGARDALKARTGPLSKGEMSMLTAKAAILGRRTLTKGELVVAAGNAINGLSEDLPCNTLGREMLYSMDWAKLAVGTSTPVWFLNVSFAQSGWPRLELAAMKLPPVSGNAQGSPVESWTRSYATVWEHTAVKSPGMVRPEWIRHWQAAPMGKEEGKDEG